MNKLYIAGIAVLSVLAVLFGGFVAVRTAPTTPSGNTPPQSSSGHAPTSTDVVTVPGSGDGWEKGMRVVTQNNNFATTHLKKNERFVIQLGDMLWTITFDPTGIISRVPNSTTANGIQGVYQADAVGTTKLHAVGRPNCKPNEMCAQFMVDFKATLVVDK